MQLIYILLVFVVAFATLSLALILLITQANNRSLEYAQRNDQQLQRIRRAQRNHQQLHRQRTQQAKGIKQ